MPLTLFLCGDVMTGRGIDQVMPHPCDPMLFEPWVTDATEYVSLAERKNGPIPRGAEPPYVWGDALEVLERIRPDARIINLETSITRSDDAWPAKGINYRMSPDHVACLQAAGIDCCCLANNHVLDWGFAGLLDTLDTLAAAGLKTAGAGRDLDEAIRPAILPLPHGGRLLVFACGDGSSGIPAVWAAQEARPGVHRLVDFGDSEADAIASRAAELARPGDVVLVSVHWGGNWGYEVPSEHVRFARRLVEAGVDVVHGHSSHHPRPIEVYRDRPILYGCGDFLNDYEGISGQEEYRGDLVLMYLISLDPRTRALVDLTLVPFRIVRFRLQHASIEESRWLAQRLAALVSGLRIVPPDRDGWLRTTIG